ncbi:MAG: hypothetical protein FWG87_11290 [Defluviitaleaceae bacterium]|nr:hypothetical protein [Defluviitaleaceae bacterium]
MRFVDLGFHLEYVENEEYVESVMNLQGCDKKTATQQDYKAHWKQKAFDFDVQTRCVCALFSRLIGRTKINGCRKLIIHCVPHIPNDRVFHLDGLYEVRIQFNHDDFVSLNDYDKKAMTLELLMTGLRKTARCLNWEIEPLEEVYARVKELGYVNEWFWNKKARCPRKKYTAQLHIMHGVKQVDISIVLTDKSGAEIKREIVASGRPDEWFYTPYLGEIKWADEDTVVLVDRDRKEWFLRVG